MLGSDSKSTALSTELRAHHDYYRRLSLIFKMPGFICIISSDTTFQMISKSIPKYA
jgi:hypothetical protein